MMRLLLLALLLALPTPAAPVPKADWAKAERERLWRQFRHGSNVAFTEAVCRFLTTPDATTEFFATKLRPLTLTRKEAERLIARLGSEKESVWKPAFDELNYLDPRLALSVDECWALAKTDDHRRRLAWVLMDGVKEGTGEFVFTLDPPKKPDHTWRLSWLSKARSEPGPRIWSFCDVAKDMSEMCGPKGTDFRWNDHGRAVDLLARMDTPTGWRLIEAVADGHPDTPPTVAALAALAWREGGKRPTPRTDAQPTPADQRACDWNALGGSINRGGCHEALVAFVLDDPAGTVAFLKGKLRPLKLDKKRADELVADLFSEKEGEWKGALAEFAELDLRLAYPVKEAWKLAKTADQRAKMVMALHHAGPRVVSDLFWCDVTLADKVPDLFVGAYGDEAVKDALFYKMRSRPDTPKEVWQRMIGADGDIFAPGNFATLNEFFWASHESAVHILDAIGTADATAIIKDMATGHPDAGPTKAAKDVLNRRGIK